LIDIDLIKAGDCRDSVRARYSAAIVADRYVRIYEQATGQDHFDAVIKKAALMERERG
jgi:hypothetical protein